MKVIFLDIDGVLHTFGYDGSIAKSKSTGSFSFDRRCVEELNKLVSETKARIVISSSWRLQETKESLDFILRENGYTEEPVLDCTPGKFKLDSDDRWSRRGDEIHLWLKDWPGEKITGFVIIDDDRDMNPYMDHLVLCQGSIGLTPRKRSRAVDALKQEWSFET